jgi:hypothetical protein
MAEGEVENINPAIETIFSILGHTEPGRDGEIGVQKLTFILEVDFNLIPGVVAIKRSDNEEFDRIHCADRYFSMDMPNLMEKWRVEYTIAQGNKLVEVLWKVESERLLVEEKKMLIQERGWEILGEEEAEYVAPPFLGEEPPPVSHSDAPRPTIRFMLKRKELRGPTIAADPNPYPYSLREGPDA